MWKAVIAVAIIGLVGAVLFVLIGFNQMAYQISVRPYEEPQMQPPEGTVSYFAEDRVLPADRAQAASLVNPVPYSGASLRGEKAYRSYCLACHGANLDGFGPVGPSLPAKIPHLAGERVRGLTDGEIYWHIMMGGKVAPPIGQSMSERQRWDVINFIRSRQGGPREQSESEGANTPEANQGEGQ